MQSRNGDPRPLYVNGTKSAADREMNSFETESPGKRPRFFSQKMQQNEPEKKIPSTHANATRRFKKSSLDVIHLKAHSPFLRTIGTVSRARKSRSFSLASLEQYVSIKSEYLIRQMIFSL